MQNEIIMTAKTVDEALERAYEEMGATSDETSFEILQMPKKGFLGLRNIPAKVRVYRLEAEEPAKPVKESPKPAAPQKEAPKREKKESQPRPPKKAASVQQKEAPAPKAEPVAAEEPLEELELSEKAKVAAQYVGEILEQMGVKNAVVTPRQTRESIEIRLEGDGLGVIIGRRGETLDAVQYLTSLVANRMGGDYMRISIDSGDYRKKRAETLERLATKLARNAVKTGRSTKLEPMNPYERRIIHAAVSKVEGATSSSIGEEPNRRVVISSKNPRKRTDAPKEGRSAGGSRRGGERSRSRGPRENREPRERQEREGRQGNAQPVIPGARIDDQITAEELARLNPPPAPKTEKPQVQAPAVEEEPQMPHYSQIDLPE